MEFLVNEPFTIFDLPSELLTEFHLTLDELVKLALTCSHFYKLMKNKRVGIKIWEFVTYTPPIKRWRHLLQNIRIDDYISNNLNWISRVHTLNLSCTFVSNDDIRVLGMTGRIDTLDLSYTGVTNVSYLGKIRVLDLSHTKVVDVHALGKVHTLDLSHTKVYDVSALTGVHTLDLSSTKVKNVSALKNVHTLNLSWCFKITDVSALGAVHTIDIRYTKVADLSALDAVNTLICSTSMDEVD